jgi:multicomponent Na+:H+ antiporter subunit G
MTWTLLADSLAAASLLAGALLCLVAAIGMVRLPDLLSRMHAATKPQVLGLVLVVGGLALRLRDPSVLGILALVVLLQLLTAPVAGHMVGRASFRARLVRDDLLVVDELSGTLDRPDHPDTHEPRGAP